MPLPQKWNKKRKAPPSGFDVVEPVLEALENELRDKVKETDAKQRKLETCWPVHQINWQKSRYIYDMYYTHKRISRAVYQYCLDQKLVDGALIAKWKKPGYERLCSTYVINPSNYKFGTVSICRVPYSDRNEEQKLAKDPTTGCMGCASGKGCAPRNCFGNKYGQNLAAVQIAREKRMEAKRLRQQQEQDELERKEKESEEQMQQQADDEGEAETDDDDDETDDDDDDDDDFGPAPVAGIWAGSERLKQESERMGDDTSDDDDFGPPEKKVRPS